MAMDNRRLAAAWMVMLMTALAPTAHAQERGGPGDGNDTTNDYDIDVDFNDESVQESTAGTSWWQEPLAIVGFIVLGVVIIALVVGLAARGGRERY